MKILLLSRYSRLGASSRIRSFQYLPYLNQHGIKVDVQTLFNDDYVKHLQTGANRKPEQIVKAYFQRLSHLRVHRQYDAIWFEKEIFPWLPDFAEKWLRQSGKPYIVDYDDAVFHHYDLNTNPFIRALLGKKLDQVMRNAELVITGNRYLERRATKAGAKKIQKLPSVIDINRYLPKEKDSLKAGEKFSVGWIGSPTTAKYLDRIIPVVDSLCAENDTRFIIVGAGKHGFNSKHVESRDWSETTEVSDILDFDVGIMPLPDTPWTRGKCGYKLIQYMACCLPVVASPVGANIDIVKHGENGFFADGAYDWKRALTRLKNNRELCWKMGSNGRKRVEKEYCLQITAPRLKGMLEKIMQRN